MADRYWIKATAGVWNNTANWSTSSGGGGGASVPGSSDRAIFDGGGLGNCDASAAFYTVDAMELRSGYTGQFQMPSRAFTINSDLKLASGATISLTGSAQDRMVCKGNFSQFDGTLTGTAQFVLSPPTSGSSDLAAGTFDCLAQLGLNNTNFTTVLLAGTHTFNKELELWYQKAALEHNIDLATHNPNLIIKGDVVWTELSSGNVDWNQGTGTITFSGTADQDVDFDAASVEDIDVDKSSGTVTLQAAVDTDSLTLTSGTLDIDGNVLTVAGNFTGTGGAISDTAGTGDILVGGNFSITDVTWDDAALDVTGTAEAHDSTITGSDASDGTEVDASDNCTDGGGNTNWSFGAAGSPWYYYAQQHLVAA